jgi:transposase-like protein
MSTNNRRRYRREPFWRRLIQEWRKSGLSVRAFCHQHDLSEPNFYTWRRTLAQRDAARAAVSFVPVRVTEAPPATTDEESPPTPIGEALEVVLRGGRRLCVGVGFDGPTLQRLVTLLEEGRP